MIKFSELIEFGNPTKQQLNTLAELYYTPLNELRKVINVDLFIRSCFRSFDHEILHGRGGTSQHCFHDKGAVDISVTKSSSQIADPSKMHELAGLLINAGFTRIAYYPIENFFHCDYKCTFGKHFFISDSKSNWTKVEPSEFYKAIHE
jgi:hypothetical protein